MRHPAMSLAGGLVVVVLAAAACSNSATTDGSQRDAAGEVTDGGQVGAFRLQLGDCIEEASNEDVFDSLPVVPCDQPHQVEIYHVFDLPDGDWPGEQAVIDRSAEGCLSAFASFVGVSFAQSVYDVTPLRPTEESWDRIDDREVLCGVFELSGALKVGSARGTNR